MIIIKNIEIIEVDRDPIEILSTTKPYQAIEVFNPYKNVPEYISTNCFKELIKGRKFVRPDGQELWLGLSGQAEEIIGIQYDAWDNINDLLEDTRQELYIARKELEKIKNLNLWGRLKALFKGY